MKLDFKDVDEGTLSEEARAEYDAMETLRRMSDESIWSLMLAFEHLARIDVDTIYRSRFADICSVSRPTVYKALDALVTLDWLDMYRVGDAYNSPREIFIKSHDVIIAIAEYGKKRGELRHEYLGRYNAQKEAKKQMVWGLQC